jgi:hypothetical protein
MIEGDLECLHATHRQAGHSPMISIGQGAEGAVDERDQRLNQVILEDRYHLLHRLEHLSGAERLAREFRW